MRLSCCIGACCLRGEPSERRPNNVIIPQVAALHCLWATTHVHDHHTCGSFTHDSEERIIAEALNVINHLCTFSERLARDLRFDRINRDRDIALCTDRADRGDHPLELFLKSDW